MEAVITAVVAGCFSLAGIAMSQRKTRQGVEAVRAEVSTNHGMRAGEYLETIHAEVASVRNLAEAMERHQAQLAQALTDHTIADAENFERLRRLIADKESRG